MIIVQLRWIQPVPYSCECIGRRLAPESQSTSMTMCALTSEGIPVFGHSMMTSLSLEMVGPIAPSACTGSSSLPDIWLPSCSRPSWSGFTDACIPYEAPACSSLVLGRGPNCCSSWFAVGSAWLCKCTADPAPAWCWSLLAASAAPSAFDCPAACAMTACAAGEMTSRSGGAVGDVQGAGTGCASSAGSCWPATAMRQPSRCVRVQHAKTNQHRLGCCLAITKCSSQQHWVGTKHKSEDSSALGKVVYLT